MAFDRRGRQETVTVTSFGIPEQVTLRQLSAYDTDELRRKHPPPLAPRKDVEGVSVIDDKDDSYRRDLAAWNERFLLMQICAQVVEPKFDSDDIVEQTVALCSSRTRDEMVDLATKAWLIGRGEMTQQHAEAAKERLIPTESAEQATSPT